MLVFLLWFIVFSTIAANFAVAYIVFTNNPKSSTNRLIAALCIVTFFWTIFNYLALLPGSETMRLFWVKAVMLFTTPYGTIILLLSLAFPNTKQELNKYFRLLLIFYNIITGLLAVSPYMFTGIKNLPDGSFTLTPGLAILVYAVGFMGFMTAGFIILIKKYRHTKGILKKQFQFFIIGLISSFASLSFTNFLSVVLLHTIQYTSLGPPLTMIMIGCITYAIVRHRFLDIRIVAANTIAFTMVLTVLTGIYILAVLLVGSFILGITIQKNEIIFSIILTLLLAFSIQPLQKIIEKITDKIFYKDHYDSSDLLETLGRLMASTISIEDLTQRFLNKLLLSVKISRGSLLILNNNIFTWMESSGYQVSPVFDQQHITEIAQYTYPNQPSNNGYIIVFEELEEGPLKEIFRKYNLTIAIRLFVKNEVIGLLLLGEKSSGDIYSSEDIDVFEILAPELAVAIQNAKSYQEIQKFNFTLQEEVDKATKELKLANGQLREMDNLKDEFITITSHELRTPLTAIKSYAWMVLNNKAGTIDPKTQEFVNRIYTSTQRMINLVNDMLDVSSIESKQVEIHANPFDIIRIIFDTLHEFRVKSLERKLTINVSHDDDLPHAYGDAEKIRQVLENLLSNALKFTPDGGRISISISRVKEELIISVIDSGKGISQDDQQKLFKKFERLANSLDALSGDGGTGLGLYICKQYVELNKGRIWVESEVGKGSTFTFTIPIAHDTSRSSTSGIH